MPVTEVSKRSGSTSPILPVALSFFAIYFLWGSTYLAIRIAVHSVPPLLAAGIRFTIAGILLYGWSRVRGTPSPTRVQWRNLAILGALMFLLTYGGLFWAEMTLPSGIASVLVATIPVWTALFEICIFKRERFRWPLAVAVSMGLVGVATLALGSGSGQLGWLACLAVIACEISWSLGTVLSKEMDLPASKFMSAGSQMLLGGIMLLAVSALIGELTPHPRISLQAFWAIAYLIIAGSLIAYTAYTWLLDRLSATRIASYAYVNPVIALALGAWLGGEELTARTIGGAALVLASVVLLLGNFSSRRTSSK